ncbi:MAG: hypothetical protein ACLFTK_01555 [Anaerolineales bacterium]
MTTKTCREFPIFITHAALSCVARLRAWLWLVLLLTLGLAACDSDESPDFGDPLPNVRAGLEAMYSGDLAGVDRYFCDEIVLSVREMANDFALQNGEIIFHDVDFEVIARQGAENWTVEMTGVYSIVMNGRIDRRNTDEVGRVLIGVQAEDDIWKICAFGGDPVVTVPEPPATVAP